MLLLKLKISGHSMLPDLEEGDSVLVSNIPYIFNKPRISDIVAFKYKDKIFIKRIKSVKNNKYFVQGDNKKDSIDSRTLGLITKNQILGKFIHKL